MNKFIKTIIVFLFVFFIFDKLFYPLLEISPSLEIDTRLENLVNGDINKDIIIIGSSRGARNLIAGQIEDSLGLSVYNLSYPGSDIEFHKFLLYTLLKFNDKPRMILLALDEPDELLHNNTQMFRLDRLYPLAKYNYINNEMISRREKNQVSRFLVLARINKSNFDLNRKHFTELDTLLSCGSMPISFQRIDRPFKFDSLIHDYPIQSEIEKKVSDFLEFQEICFSNDIELILIFSPNFQLFNVGFYDRIKQLSPKVNHLVFDTTNAVYYNKSYYFDESHLQKKGSIIFTNEVINYLKCNYSISGKSTI